MLLANKKVAIIGAGPGGLTLARLLQLKNIEVKLYERDVNEEARVQGSPLDMHEASGMAAIIKANLTEAFNRNIYTGADKKLIVNERAEIFFSDHEGTANQGFNSKFSRPEINRGALRKIFLESLTPGTVEWNRHFISMEKQGGGWRLHFKDSPSLYADVVVAADGANSKIRPYLTSTNSFYTGIVMLEVNLPKAAKTAPHIYALLGGGKIMAFGNSQCILGGQKGNNDLGFYVSFKAGEDWPTMNGLNYKDRTQLLSWFKSTYNEWSPFWYELFEKVAIPVIPRLIYCMPIDQNWEALPNLTMLGDAAHVMPPFAGEGANTAMYDALELSEFLTGDKFSHLQEAISFYEISMRKRAALAAKQSLENGERMFSEEALDKMLQVFGR